MNERVAIADVDGHLKWVSRSVLCGECGGAGCRTCQQQGWRHARGRELSTPKASGDARTLLASGEPTSRAFYDAL